MAVHDSGTLACSNGAGTNAAVCATLRGRREVSFLQFFLFSNSFNDRQAQEDEKERERERERKKKTERERE